jgi:hypothetical protein
VFEKTHRGVPSRRESGLLARTKGQRPDLASTVRLLVRPFGIVDPRPQQLPIRVAELQVGNVVLDADARRRRRRIRGLIKLCPGGPVWGGIPTS